MNTKDLRRADQLLKKQQWRDALSILQRLEDNDYGEGNDILLPRLAQALNGCKRYQQSFDYIADNADSFLTDKEKASIWLTAALGAGEFIPARLYIQQCQKAWQGDFLQQIENAEDLAHQTSTNSIQSELKTFYHLGDKPVTEQSKYIADGMRLPLSDFVTGSKFLLRDPFTNAFIRSNLIEYLNQLGVNEKIKYLWVDQKEYEVNPAKINDLGKEPILLKTQQELKERLAHDPVQQVHMAGQLSMQAMLLYPRLNKIIDDPKAWVDGLLASDDQSNPAPTSVRKWQKKLNREIESLEDKII